VPAPDLSSFTRSFGLLLLDEPVVFDPHDSKLPPWFRPGGSVQRRWDPKYARDVPAPALHLAGDLDRAGVLPARAHSGDGTEIRGYERLSVGH
jgi:hypothetical protein